LAIFVIGADMVLKRWSPPRLSYGAGLITLIVLFVAAWSATYLRLRDFRTELAFWQDVVSKVPESTRALTNLGGAYLKEKRLDECGPLMLRALEIDPYFSAGHNNLGLYLLAVGRNDDAVREFVIARDLAPKAVLYRANLGAALDRAGRADDAVAELTQAIALNDDYVAVRVNLANVLARRGRYAEALTHLERAIELDPRNLTCQENLNQLRADLAQAPVAPSRTVAMP
jgi:tetratricopeptide (TPR) repeat protein